MENTEIQIEEVVDESQDNEKQIILNDSIQKLKTEEAVQKTGFNYKKHLQSFFGYDLVFILFAVLIYYVVRKKIKYKKVFEKVQNKTSGILLTIMFLFLFLTITFSFNFRFLTKYFVLIFLFIISFALFNKKEKEGKNVTRNSKK